MLDFNTRRHVNEAAPAEYRAVERAEFVVPGWDDFAEPFPEDVRTLLELIRAPHENHSLVRDRLFDIGVHRLTVELRFHPRQKLSFALRNAESLEGALNILGNLFPSPLGGLAGGQVIADQVKVDLFQLVPS